MGKAADKLAEQLEDAEERIAELEAELRMERERREWTAHEDPYDGGGEDLPVPRLELSWESGRFPRGYKLRCTYRLVYRHTLGQLVGVPLGETMTDGSMTDFLGDKTKIRTPFRDGVHILRDSEQLGLPAFVRTEDGMVQRIIRKDGVLHTEDL